MSCPGDSEVWELLSKGPLTYPRSQNEPQGQWSLQNHFLPQSIIHSEESESQAPGRTRVSRESTLTRHSMRGDSRWVKWPWTRPHFFLSSNSVRADLGVLMLRPGLAHSTALCWVFAELLVTKGLQRGWERWRFVLGRRWAYTWTGPPLAPDAPCTDPTQHPGL